MLDNWPARKATVDRVNRLDRIISRFKASTILSKRFERCWESALLAIEDLQRESLTDSGSSSLDVARNMKRAWVSLDNAYLNEEYRLDGLTIYSERPSVSLSIPIIIVRREGPWEMAEEMGHIIRNHPFGKIALLTSAQSHDPKDTVMKMIGNASFLEGFDYGYAAKLQSKIQAPFGGDWLRDAREDPSFWKILREAINMGKVLAAREILDDPSVAAAIRHGIAMSPLASKDPWVRYIQQVEVAHYERYGKWLSPLKFRKSIGAIVSKNPSLTPQGEMIGYELSFNIESPCSKFPAITRDALDIKVRGCIDRERAKK